MTVDTSTGILQYSKVETFLDRDETKWQWFVKLESDDGETIMLTPSHLILAACDEKDVSPIFAAREKPGHVIFVCKPDNNTSNPESVPVAKQVVNVELIQEHGIFAPLTQSGTLIVNRVAVSCYAEIENQRIADLAMKPLMIAYIIRNSLNHGNGKKWNRKSECQFKNTPLLQNSQATGKGCFS